MKELKQYQCEHCKTVYSEKRKAEQCEKNHKVKVKVVKMVHRPVSDDASGYPLYVMVKFDDGQVVKYKKCGLVES